MSAPLPLANHPDQAEDEAMFSVHCPRHGTTVLLNERRIVGIDRGPGGDGLTVRWVCWCGHHGSHGTGRARHPSIS